MVEVIEEFQTNPRGVEAVGTDGLDSRCVRFQTNPRGVEAAGRGDRPDRSRVSDEPSWG